MLLDYLHTYQNVAIRFYCSDMKLHVDSDAVYLVAPKAKSRIAGYFYCSNISPNTPLGDTENCPNFLYLIFSIIKINLDHIIEKICLI